MKKRKQRPSQKQEQDKQRKPKPFVNSPKQLLKRSQPARGLGEVWSEE